MSFARGLRFQVSLTRIGAEALIGVARDRAGAYTSRLTGKRTAPLTDFDPFSEAAMADPYPGYRAMHTAPDAPSVWYSRKRGIWIIPGYRDVWQALRDDDALSSAQSQARFRVHLPTMNSTDAPRHTRLRKFVSRAFTPRAMKSWEAAINEVADELVENMLDGGRAEVVAELANPLPNRLIATMLGIPRADHARFLTWSDATVEAAFAPLNKFGLHSRSAQATTAMHRKLLPLIRERRGGHGDDLISMMAGPEGGDALTDDEVFWSAAMLVGAGSETTRNLLSGLFLTFAEHPDVYTRLRENPDLIPAAIEEQLRLVSPVQGFYRTALRDYTVGEQTIPAGARVLLLYAAANRDPRHYDDPDVFDLDRNPTDHVAFGGGVHYCLGTHLSRMEVRRVLSQVIPRVKAIELDGEYRYLRNATMRGLQMLPVRFVPADPDDTSAVDGAASAIGGHASG